MSQMDEVRSLDIMEITALFWLCCGLTNDEIAAEMDVAQSTVSYHLGNIYDKFKIKGEGREKRYKLACRYQRFVFYLIESADDLKKWKKIFPPPPLGFKLLKIDDLWIPEPEDVQKLRDERDDINLVIQYIADMPTSS